MLWLIVFDFLWQTLPKNVFVLLLPTNRARLESLQCVALKTMDAVAVEDMATTQEHAILLIWFQRHLSNLVPLSVPNHNPRGSDV